MKKNDPRWYQARESLHARVVEDLMGPEDASPLSEPPLNRIIVGVLHPRSATSDSVGRRGIDDESYREGMAEDAAEGSTSASHRSSDGGDPDPAVALSHSKAPASAGLTFAVEPAESPTVDISVTARRYSPAPYDQWIPTDVAASVTIETQYSRTYRDSVSVAEHLSLTYVVRSVTDGVARITVALVNDNVRVPDTQSDALCWFRPSISVTANRLVDRRRPEPVTSSDFDRRSSAFLYRDHPAIAIGHGCAVEWEQSQVVRSAATTFFPSHDVRLADPNGGGPDDPFGEYSLFMDSFTEIGFDRGPIKSMISAYENWIQTQTDAIPRLPQADQDTANEHVAAADVCLRRMHAGLRSLDDERVDQAFRLMNEAMVAQRNAQDRARGTTSERQKWRPFQMAFILINLPGLADPGHPDREIADLLWFPTGGGKTEAYLGCIAFTIMLRRLRFADGEIGDDGGVSAIMRYTLRLLTRQQFERAAGLICALESIRRDRLPTASPITLGLWVGQATSPNALGDAEASIKRQLRGQDAGDGNPVQLLSCPWCGTELNAQNYTVGDSMVIACGQSTCEFGDGLPLYLVDEDVYAKRPTLLIGTVDKFAQMSWRHEVARLLPTSGPTPPPELIIQDEMHLISGPLGTMVGLYESVVDAACSASGSRPKVLASTATIRRASTQVRAVFDREAHQFPPPGLSPDDNYFARPASPEEKGTRRYVGVMAPGTSHATLLVRLYAVILQAGSEIDADDEVRDAYWTLLGYFNSLRVLGSTYLQVLDDVPKRIGVLAERSEHAPRQVAEQPIELTSRIDQARIPSAMHEIEQAYPAAPDVVLATNMISVGLDIDRLGLMVVAGQPQSTSEYIQSTSRVGRRYPGLVFVALNAQRSRDKSHYESFIQFHRALYREVEATTATPFAGRARDRGAHGVLVAAARLLVPGLSGDTSAPAIADHSDQIQMIIDALVSRCRSVAGNSEAEAFDVQLKNLVSDWSAAAVADRIDRYGKMVPARARGREDPKTLLVTADSGNLSPDTYPVGSPPWPTLTSMRDVDADTSLFVKNLSNRRKN